MQKTAFFIVLSGICFLCGCTEKMGSPESVDRQPAIFPDYTDLTIPVNIAPLNFMLVEGCQKIEVRFLHNEKIALTCRGRRKIEIPLKTWQSMLQKSAGSSMAVQVYALQSGRWKAYRPFHIRVASDSIDPYIAYRLIEPVYDIWSQMGLYQRNLSTFDEYTIIDNRLTEYNCVNCHSFHAYNPGRMMFHSRGAKFSGTFLLTEGRTKFVDTKTENSSSAGTYPVWHPSGNYIAFSSNTTKQTFNALPGKKIEVYDLGSNLIVWDVENEAMIRDKRFTTNDVWETFPEWSPDGRRLYYCFAGRKNMPAESKELLYGLCSVDFDASTGRFGSQIDTIISPATAGKSISFPRISPDGRYLLYTASAYATFPIWHKEADLEMIDLGDGSTVDIQAVNSEEADSYHSWSSNGRWIVFSSRRVDGLHTRPFFAYFDPAGKIHKPFLLPQKDPEMNRRLLKSYNIPEFIKGKVNLNPYEVGKVMAGKTKKLKEINQ